MPIIARLADALAWLGRQGTRAVAISILLGLALPPLAGLFKPLVPAAIFILLCLAFLRVDPDALRGYLRRPLLPLAATAWIMLAVPAVLGLGFLALGLREAAPALFLALILQAAAPPIISSPAFAALLGIDAALALAALILCTAATPLTAPLFASAFGGGATLSPPALGARLLLILAGAALVAFALRRLAGRAAVERQAERIDGLNVLMLFVFAMAVMEEVGIRVISEPGLVLALTALAFALALGLAGLTALVFLRAGLPRALALGLAAGHRNVGLMLAASGAAMPDLAWLYFGLAQLPIYLLPYFLTPLARRLACPDGAG